MTYLSRREALGVIGTAVCALQGHSQEMRGQDAAKTPPPNFIIVFADDLGYGDLGCYGAEKIKTPHLDRMAAEGIRFTDFYACAPACTPSRAGLLTGQYPIRLGLTAVLFPNSKQGLEPTTYTISRLLKERGYATACIGKWHLGHLPEFLPTRHGFDSYFGIPYSNDMDNALRKYPPTPLMRNEKIIEQPVDQDTLTLRYTEEAVRFIEQHHQQPFFLYLPHTMPHVPLHVSNAFRGHSERGLYGDVIEEMDWGMGEIIKTLDTYGIASNTLVIFSSDNGPWLRYGDHGGSAGILRNGKGSTFEGGMRVPCIMRMPKLIAPGRVERTVASTLDLLPTLCELAGIPLPEGQTLDGHSLYPVLAGSGPKGNEEFYYFNNAQLEAYRAGKWKLKAPFDGIIQGEKVTHPLLLFDLDADPGEQNNLAEMHPEVVAQMEATMHHFWQSLQPLPRTKT